MIDFFQFNPTGIGLLREILLEFKFFRFSHSENLTKIPVNYSFICSIKTKSGYPSCMAVLCRNSRRPQTYRMGKRTLGYSLIFQLFLCLKGKWPLGFAS